MIPQKRQAFVQLPDVTSAANLVTFYQTRDALIRGKKIFFEFSNRDEITVRSDNDAPSYQQQQQPPQRTGSYGQPPSMQYGSRQDMPQYRADDGGKMLLALCSIFGKLTSCSGTITIGQPGSIPHEGARRGIGPPNQILMVSVSKIEYDVTVDVLQQKFGNVEKIVTFWKDNEFKALVQMESVDQAQAAQSALDGRDIYTGCNQLSIVFSRHPELRVRYNDDRSRDYTNPNLPPGPGRGDNDSSGSNPNNSAISERRDMPRDGGYGNAPTHRDDYRGPTNGPSGGRNDNYTLDARDSRGPPSRFDEGPPSVDRPHDLRGGRELPPHSTGRAIRGDTRPSPALICSNIDRELVVSALFILLYAIFNL
ncbi:unnamed protein product [Phytophthora fragariaefolia]|uniref:Unnamed protein product n=1 Tax=Phytophthora fragariaefolia TaxID=1490495 RepID=A0A9W7CVS4_9STRA|nr:unnamed protein product [Phytophthora fragariaefolia]